jgi:uncharacterized protein
MPLEKGNTKEAIAANVKTEEAAGKPHDQAVAIALHTAKDGEDLPAAGVCFVCRETGRVLLLCRPDGSWGFPAGRVEAGESPDEAARRETMEETGFVPLMPLRVLGQYENLRAYSARVDQFPVTLNEEHCGFGWFAPDKMPGNLHRTTGHIVGAAVADNVAMDERDRDINGWLEVSDNPIMAVGVYPYLGKRIKGAPNPDQFYNVYRPAEEVSDPDCMASFRLLPWIDDHLMLGEGDNLTPAEAKPIEGVIGEQIYFDPNGGKYGQMKGNIKIWTATHEGRIGDGKRELSLGYRCKFDYEPGVFDGVPYTYVQRMMRGNHLASVDDGRSGPEIAVMDARDFTFITDSLEYSTMSKKQAGGSSAAKKMTPKVQRMSNILRGFLQFVQDEEDKPEADRAGASGELDQLKELVEKAAPVINAIADIGVVASGEAEEDIDEDEGIVMDEEPSGGKKATDGPDGGKKPNDNAMDARDIRRLVRSAVREAVAEVTATLTPTMDARDVLADQRNAAKLAEQLSQYIGNFDSAMDGSDMTEEAVAKYGAEKIGLTCADGQHVMAVKSWMHGRTPPQRRGLTVPQQFAQDGKDPATKTGETPAFLTAYEKR